MFLEKLGRGIVLREIIALYNVLIYLFVPLMGYVFYSRESRLASLFLRYMRVPANVYFDLALPAISLFTAVLCWPLERGFSDTSEDIDNTISRAQVILPEKKIIGIVLLVMGLVISLVIRYLPEALQYFFTLFYMSSFAGLLYIYFSPAFPGRKMLMFLFGLFIVFSAFGNGMFTIVVYMGMTLFSFFYLKSNVSVFRKAILFVLIALVLIVIQSVKPVYRKEVLRENKENKAMEFLNLAYNRISDPKALLDPKPMFFVYYRTNQGFYVTLVQNYIPAVKPYDNGEKLFGVIASSFVPRFLWPDKPKAGGIENMRYYTGYNIAGYTVNVGPLGEAYGSFGTKGAIIYMALLAFFIRFAYRKVFSLARTYPLIVFWIPVLFYEVSYSGENDTLQIMNSIVKSSLFLFLLFKILPSVFVERDKTALK